ncbi:MULTISPECIES: TetR family transcriptional regulator [Cryobacterium]|uniref:TetR family transcriptional regulator n=1 Tax=Cryobacterium TaxID=69578 RepID=UPI000CD3E400|nr:MULTISPECIES: TetR family transcriptional regulator [Cryobacterium]POH65725.1 TetR family transcriptional regulator [Cryobacterium zongtaii]TFC45424.1 TetR/AcrR family transcriptional regulator [Cryobacterium sp. TMN-39-2]
MKRVDSPSGLPPKEPAPTRQRILEAARVEFAAYGLAGARIDRIARNASASKERLYAYYRHKADLFSAVLELNLIEFASAVEQGAGESLPEFAGALYDHSVAHPEYLRMIDWANLEGQDLINPPLALIEDFHAERVRAVIALQASGSVDASWDPDHLNALVFGIVSCWIHEPAAALAADRAPDPATVAARRASAVRGVERLIG